MHILEKSHTNKHTHTHTLILLCIRHSKPGQTVRLGGACPLPVTPRLSRTAEWLYCPPIVPSWHVVPFLLLKHGHIKHSADRPPAITLHLSFFLSLYPLPGSFSTYLYFSGLSCGAASQGSLQTLKPHKDSC